MSPTPKPTPAALGPMLSFEVSVDSGRVRLTTRHDGMLFVTRIDPAQANDLGCQLLRASFDLGFRPTTIPQEPPRRPSAEVDTGRSPEAVAHGERLLQDAMACADAIAQDGLSRIAGLARIVLTGLESPHSHISPEHIAQVFITIEEIAERTEELISLEADRVGCRHTDDAVARRSDAREAHRARRIPT